MPYSSRRELEEAWVTWLMEKWTESSRRAMSPEKGYLPTRLLTYTFRNPSPETPFSSSEWTLPGRSFVTRAMGRAVASLRESVLGSSGVKYFMVAELGERTGRLHCHALYKGPGWLAAEHLRWWSKAYGFASERVVDSEFGAVRYLCKYLVKDQRGTEQVLPMFLEVE